MKVEIRVPSRLHFALCDLRPASLYANGGIGLGIEEPSLQISCSNGRGKVELYGEAVQWKTEVFTLLKHLSSLIDVSNLDIEVISHFPAHSGFGSHTALALGVVEATGLRMRMNWSEQEIVNLSQRGGTSGVGIQTYFLGGLAYDFGRPEMPENFLPSSASPAKMSPIFGPRVEFPKHWEILLALPDGKNIYGDEEIRFFASHTPIEEIEALRAIASIHHGVIPAIASSDLSSLGASLRNLHLSGFKAMELKHQSQSVRETYENLATKGIACGISSFGPLIYAIVDKNDKEKKEYFEEVVVSNSTLYFGCTTPSRGRTVTIK